MKCVTIVFALIAGLIFVQGALARSTISRKKEDGYIARENDISNDAPLLPLEGGLQDAHEYNLQFADMFSGRNLNTEGNFNMENPYESTYNLERFYDVDNPFYMGSGMYSDDFPTDFEKSSSIMDLPEGAIISESYGEPVQGEPSDDSEMADDNTPETTEEPLTPQPYWSPPAPEADQVPYIMAIPAQLQGFSMFNIYDEYEEQNAAEIERERQEKEDHLRDRNVVAEELSEQPGRRVRRGLSRRLHLRNKIADSKETGAKSLRDNHVKENIVQNDHAECGGYGRGGGRRGNGNDGAQNGSNGVNDVAGAAQAAAGAAQNAAGAATQAVDAVQDAADNLRLSNGRTGGRQRNGNNGRRGQ